MNGWGMSQESVCIRRQIFVQNYAFRRFSMDLCNCEILKIASIRALPYISRGGFFQFFYFTEIVEMKNKSKELYGIIIIIALLYYTIVW